MPGTVVMEGEDDTEGNAVRLQEIDQDDCAEKVLFVAFRDIN